jgi:hypothetical protein
LSEEASKYQNSSVGENTGKEWIWYILIPFVCGSSRNLADERRSSLGLAQLLYVACQCSSMVYDPIQQPRLAGFDLRPVMHRTPSMTGTVKASSMWKIENAPVPELTGKTLIVSIRGTATGADHIVNMNGERKDAGSVFVRAGPWHPLKPPLAYMEP